MELILLSHWRGTLSDGRSTTKLLERNPHLLTKYDLLIEADTLSNWWGTPKLIESFTLNYGAITA